MLVLEGRCVGLNSDSYVNKNDREIHTHRLTVAGENGLTTVLLPHEHLGSMDLVALRTFGTAVRVTCEPALDYDFGKPKPALRAIGLEVLADVNGVKAKA